LKFDLAVASKLSAVVDSVNETLSTGLYAPPGESGGGDGGGGKGGGGDGGGEG